MRKNYQTVMDEIATARAADPNALPPIHIAEAGRDWLYSCLDGTKGSVSFSKPLL